MSTRYFAPNLALTFAHAKHDGVLTWEHLNELWYDLYAPDRRYKIYFSASTDLTYIMHIGHTEFLVEFYGGAVYCRAVWHDIYDHKPCFVAYYDHFKCDFTVEFQRDHLI